jgi:serine/threonine protein phosphatase PrpC
MLSFFSRMSPTPADTASSPASSPPDCVPAAVRGELTVRSHGRTDRGRTRESNEDQFLIARLNKCLKVLETSLHQSDMPYSSPQGHLFAVADGVGGSAAGEQASALAIDTVESFVVAALRWGMQLSDGQGDCLLNEFRHALEQADQRVLQEARRHPEWHGMGTTLTMACVIDREAFVAHVGDSRCYLLRQGMLYRVTRDHTLVAEMVRRGLIGAEEAVNHAYRHVITNVVGGSDAGVQVEMHRLALEPGDCLLLCSDGLTEMVADDEVLRILQEHSEPADACDLLIERANEQGGKDNITVIVARFAE